MGCFKSIPLTSVMEKPEPELMFRYHGLTMQFEREVRQACEALEQYTIYHSTAHKPLYVLTRCECLQGMYLLIMTDYTRNEDKHKR